MRRSRTLLVSSLLPLALASGCAFRETVTAPGDLAPKLARSTYVEEGSEVALVVSTRPTRHRLARPFIPLEVAIANKGLERLTLTPESFVLRDGSGNEYPVVGREELGEGYGSTDVDRNFAEALPFLRNKFASYRREPSNFTPGFDAPIARARVGLARFTYLYDFLYFPNPGEELARQPMQLVVSAPELEDRLFIRFLVE